MAGATFGGLDGSNSGSSDIFLVKYNSSGVRQWTKQLGTTSEDVAYGIRIDSNDHIYLTGYTKGDPWNVVGNLDNETNSGNSDAFILKYYDNSTLHWTTLLGTSNAEVGRSIARDSSNNLYVTGDNNTADGDYDAFISKYNSSLSPQWTKEISSDNTTSSYADYGYGVVVNSDGYIYAVGNTGGEIDNNTNSGEQDVFIFKYDSSGTKQ